jgi:hypothetical protein
MRFFIVAHAPGAECEHTTRTSIIHSQLWLSSAPEAGVVAELQQAAQSPNRLFAL